MRTWQANPPKAVMTYSQPKNGSAKKKVDSQKGKAFLSLVWVDEQNILTSSTRQVKSITTYLNTRDIFKGSLITVEQSEQVNLIISALSQYAEWI